MNELVVAHNDLIDLPLKKFNASEIDILHTICYSVKEKGGNEVVISFDRIKNLSHYQNKNESQLEESIRITNKKLMNLNFEIESADRKKVVQFVLFPTFIVDREERTLTVKVNEPFVYLLNDLSGNYTSFELQQSAELRSTYSKQIYKKLQEFKHTGIWVISLDKFKKYLDIPKSYRITNIDQFVIKPAIEELKDIFAGLKCEKTYKKADSGRGRPKVVGYEWRFTAFTKEKRVNEPTQEGIAEITEYKKTSWYCPKCHRPIYKRQLENENGTYWIYGHSDFKTGGCDFKTFNSEDLLLKHQLESDQPETDEQKHNRKRLADLVSGLFRRG